MEERIQNLFKAIVKDYDHIKEICNNRILYDNGIYVIIWSEEGFYVNRYKDIFKLINDNSDLIFYIGTPVEEYKVPKFNRREYAEVVDNLEKSLKCFEEKTLKNLESYFNVDSLENEDIED